MLIYLLLIYKEIRNLKHKQLNLIKNNNKFYKITIIIMDNLRTKQNNYMMVY